MPTEPFSLTNPNKKQVILVNELDQELGHMDKLEAHQQGLLHRAFSIFIFNSQGELLLQQRALNKYHSARVWSNTCCSHPQPGENLINSAQNRLQEEMGFTCALKEAFSFIYQCTLENNLVEHELDYVLIGKHTGQTIQPNPEEVMNYQWISGHELSLQLQRHPENFSYWLKACWDKVKNNYPEDL